MPSTRPSTRRPSDDQTSKQHQLAPSKTGFSRARRSSRPAAPVTILPPTTFDPPPRALKKEGQGHKSKHVEFELTRDSAWIMAESGVPYDYPNADLDSGDSGVEMGRYAEPHDDSGADFGADVVLVDSALGSLEAERRGTSVYMFSPAAYPPSAPPSPDRHSAYKETIRRSRQFLGAPKPPLPQPVPYSVKLIFRGDSWVQSDKAAANEPYRLVQTAPISEPHRDKRTSRRRTKRAQDSYYHTDTQRPRRTESAQDGSHQPGTRSRRIEAQIPLPPSADKSRHYKPGINTSPRQIVPFGAGADGGIQRVMSEDPLPVFQVVRNEGPAFCKHRDDPALRRARKEGALAAKALQRQCENEWRKAQRSHGIRNFFSKMKDRVRL